MTGIFDHSVFQKALFVENKYQLIVIISKFILFWYKQKSFAEIIVYDFKSKFLYKYFLRDFLCVQIIQFFIFTLLK